MVQNTGNLPRSSRIKFRIKDVANALDTINEHFDEKEKPITSKFLIKDSDPSTILKNKVDKMLKLNEIMLNTTDSDLKDINAKNAKLSSLPTFRKK
jgi:hypothetical protein